jgi:hypothetical protein
MNRADMIREALDFAAMELATVNTGGHGEFNRLFCVKFAALVAAAERKACARIANSYGGPKEPIMVGTYEAGWHNAAEAIAADIRARGAEPKRHPGYIIGDHWLQAAYTRICTGETEAEVMADYGWQRESR